MTGSDICHGEGAGAPVVVGPFAPRGYCVGMCQPSCWRVAAGSPGMPCLPALQGADRVLASQRRADIHPGVVFCVKQKLIQPQESQMLLFKIKPFVMY